MVKVKLKTNKTRVYEAYSKNTVKNELSIKQKSDEERQKELADLWGRLMNQKSLNLRKLYKGKTMQDMGYSIPISKMRVPVKVDITDAITGEQTEEGTIAGIMEDSLFGKCRDINSDVSKAFCNTKAIRKAYVEQENAKNNKDPKLKQFEHVLNIEQSKTPIWPALLILGRTKTFKFDAVRNAVKSKAKK